MSAGGPANPTIFTGRRVYIPPSVAPLVRPHTVSIGRHPYDYWIARCGECGTTLQFATEADADHWAALHEERADRYNAIKEGKL